MRSKFTAGDNSLNSAHWKRHGQFAQFIDLALLNLPSRLSIGNHMDDSAIWEKLHGNKKIAQGEGVLFKLIVMTYLHQGQVIDC